VPEDSDVALAVDLSGMLYISVPASGRAGAALIESGVVLRVTREGQAPGINPSSSPIIAYGLPRPTALVVDRSGQSLWQAGRDASSSAAFATTALSGLRRSPWPAQLLVKPEIGGQEQADPGIALVMTSGGTEVPLLLIDGRLYSAAWGPDGDLVGRQEIPVTGPLVGIAGGSHGAIYVANGHRPSSVVRLNPR
jgi:hypothetical protein